MTAPRPQWDQHLLAQLLDAALDAEHRPPVPPGTGGEVEDLADLADALRVALPLPDLPAGGRSEVRAAALAVRVARRPFRARLAVAAVITLLVGAVVGGALGNAFQQQPSLAQQRFAAFELAAQSLHEATKALSAHQPAKALKDINRAAKVLQSQGAPVATTVPATATRNGEQAAIVSLQEEVAALQADNQQLRQKLASEAVTATRPPTTKPSTSTSTSSSDYEHRTAPTQHDDATDHRPDVVGHRPRHLPRDDGAAHDGARPTTVPPTTVPPTTAPDDGAVLHRAPFDQPAHDHPAAANGAALDHGTDYCRPYHHVPGHDYVPGYDDRAPHDGAPDDRSSHDRRPHHHGAPFDAAPDDGRSPHHDLHHQGDHHLDLAADDVFHRPTAAHGAAPDDQCRAHRPLLLRGRDPPLDHDHRQVRPGHHYDRPGDDQHHHFDQHDDHFHHHDDHDGAHHHDHGADHDDVKADHDHVVVYDQLNDLDHLELGDHVGTPWRRSPPARRASRRR